VTRPRGILPRPVRARYHAARRTRAAENGATKKGVFAVDPAIPRKLRTPPEAEAVREPERIAEPGARPEPEPKRSISRRALSLAILVGAIIACAATGIVIGSVVSSTGDRDASVLTATIRSQPKPKPQPQAPKRAAKPTSVPLAPGGAFDPLGDGDEHSNLVPLALDGDPSTAWSSEDYLALNKAGVGFYVDSGRPVSPTRLTLKTPTPGFALAVYGASRKRVPRSLDGWTRLGAKASVTRKTNLALGGNRYRHLLLWITSLPPGGGAVKVSEVRLRA
jgi:hypothetical protein